MGYKKQRKGSLGWLTKALHTLVFTALRIRWAALILGGTSIVFLGAFVAVFIQDICITSLDALWLTRRTTSLAIVPGLDLVFLALSTRSTFVSATGKIAFEIRLTEVITLTSVRTDLGTITPVGTQ